MPCPPTCSEAVDRSSVILPASSPIGPEEERGVVLELEDGTVFQGYNAGAARSVAGELVFQTGMVGYPESITDPSYRGQILVITFPLVGNYGVPERDTVDELLPSIPRHFESARIQVAALVMSTVSGQDYSHFLAQSSLGEWLQEQGIPAMYGVDTRALTKRIREKGSMLGRMMIQRSTGHPLSQVNGIANGISRVDGEDTEDEEEGESEEGASEERKDEWRANYEPVGWEDPNKRNLVKEGKSWKKSSWFHFPCQESRKERHILIVSG